MKLWWSSSDKKLNAHDVSIIPNIMCDYFSHTGGYTRLLDGWLTTFGELCEFYLCLNRSDPGSDGLARPKQCPKMSTILIEGSRKALMLTSFNSIICQKWTAYFFSSVDPLFKNSDKSILTERNPCMNLIWAATRN